MIFEGYLVADESLKDNRGDFQKAVVCIFKDDGKLKGSLIFVDPLKWKDFEVMLKTVKAVTDTDDLERGIIDNALKHWISTNN